MNVKLRKWRVATYLLFILLLLLFNSSTLTCAQKPNEAYIYDFPESPSSEMLLRFFKNKSDWEVTFYNLNDSSSSERFLNLTKMLTVLGVEVTPPDICFPCESPDLTLDEILTTYGSPLVGFFHDGRLTAIMIRILNYETLSINYETLEQALMMEDEDVTVFTPYNVHSLSGKDVRTRLEEFFLVRGGNDKTEINISNLVLPITLLALADSVNPCTFALFTALLFITLHSLGKMRAAATGFSFISAIFIGYYVLGLGLFRIILVTPHISKALAILGLVLGVSTILRGLKVKFKHPIPKSLRKFMELRIRNSYASVTASFILGLTASFTLLPCSGGPYIVGLGLLSTLKGSTQTYLLLTLYNLLFVMPLILVLTALLASSTISHKIKIFRSANLGIMELASGALLTIVCIYLLAS